MLTPTPSSWLCKRVRGWLEIGAEAPCQCAQDFVLGPASQTGSICFFSAIGPPLRSLRSSVVQAGSTMSACFAIAGPPQLVYDDRIGLLERTDQQIEILMMMKGISSAHQTNLASG